MFQRDTSKRRWQRVAGGLFALTISLGLVGGAMAANTVTTKVTGGTLTASTANLNLGGVKTSHVPVTKAGTMKLNADDSTGTNGGWNVTVLAGQFDYTGAYAGVAIPAANFAITAAAAPEVVVGQAVDATNGPMVPTTSPVGALDVARKVVQANQNYGKGTYTQDLDVALTIPADSLVGTYTSNLTVTITAGP